MKTLAENYGFDVHAAIDKVNPIFDKVNNMLSPNYCVVGGTAVVHWVGKHARAVSPDVDFYVLAADLPKLKTVFGKPRNGTFGVSFKVDNIDVDFLAAIDRCQRMAIKSAEIVNVGNQQVRIAKPEFILVAKFNAMRNKDMHDIRLLVEHHSDVIDKARILMKMFYPNEVEDFDSTMQLAHVWRDKED